jgi:hypothetical protein
MGYSPSMNNNTLINRKGKVYIIPAGETHFNFGKRVLKRDYIRLIKSGWIRTAYFAGRQLYAVECGKKLTTAQITVLKSVFPDDDVFHIVYSIDGKEHKIELWRKLTVQHFLKVI